MLATPTISASPFLRCERNPLKYLMTTPFIFLNCAPGKRWNQNAPETTTDALFTDPLRAVGSPGSFRTARLGLSFVISYLNGPPDTISETVRRLLALSEKHDTPVLLALDGQNWWGFRPDLWNFWDTSAPGYDSNNRQNVEWTGWEPETAVKICWRNWGRQIRVLPAPNLAAAPVRAACRPLLLRLAQQIKRWADGLPPDKSHLFCGIKVGWEASIGINAYHYPNGNYFLERFPGNPARDPQTGLQMSADFAGGLAPLGYSALVSLSRTHKGSVTLADQERVVSEYLDFLARTAREAGLKPGEIFTHAGGQFAPWDLHLSHRVAVNKNSVPGWSLYNVMPEKAGDLSRVVKAGKTRQWCVAEWFPGAKTGWEWAQAFRACLEWETCRFVCVYNWESIKDRPEALTGLRDVLESPHNH